MSRFTPRTSVSTQSPASQRGRSQGSNSDYEEFASLQLDKPTEGELKTIEEMKRHMFDDHFEGRPIERAMHILTVGEEVQRLSVIRDLQSLIQTDEQGCLQRIIQKIQVALNSASTEFHIETARVFSSILEKKTVATNVFVHGFLPSILYHVDNRDQVVSNAWLDALLKATDLLPVEVVKSSILTVALNKGQISQNLWHRIAACKLLGRMCSRFDSTIVKKDLLPVVLSLCQDVNEAVRACICSQLHLVAKGIPNDMVKSSLIPILVELARDETVQVRVEAIEAIVKIIPSLNAELLKGTIIPLIKKVCEQAILAVDDTLVMVAKQFGSLCVGLEHVLTQQEKHWMVTFYHNLSHVGIPTHGPKKDAFFTGHNMDRLNSRYIECRQYCAYNFPAIAKFSSSSPELLEEIYPSFCDFSMDPYYMVRKTIGSSMHEVARLLGPNNRVVKNQVMTLLWDNMEEVLMGIVPHLGKTIDLLISSGVLAHDQDGVPFDLGRGLLQCDKTIRDKTHNWRLYTAFITQLESIVKCLPSDYIYAHFVSLMFDKMHRARPLPCRLAAARTLLVFLRYNLKNNQRQEIRSRLQLEFCSSSSCFKRMLYLRLCNTAREVFSRAYFKEHFFYPLLSRSEDKVANNRLLLIRQFPFLKAMIMMPSEKKYLQTLETCLRSMAMSEKDRDVTAELKLLIYRMDKTETLSDGATNQTPDDVEDRRKYEEEVRVASGVARPGPQPQPGTGTDTRRGPGGGGPPEDRPFPKPNEPKGSNKPPPAGGKELVAPTPSRLDQGQASSRSPPPAIAPSATHSAPSSSRSTASSRGMPAHNSMNYSSLPGNLQGYTNTTNSIHPLRSLPTHVTNIDQSCTCYPGVNFRSENLRNLNLLALIDANLVNSKQKLSEALRQKLLEDPRIKLAKSAKRSMEISWLNLETDLKNELVALSKNRQIQGDRNFKEKSKFLTDFRNYNESTLRKFISEDRETIYNVTGVGGCCERNSNFFEERINFFERKIKFEDQKPNTNPGDCSCYELTTTSTHWGKPFEEFNKFSYFSKNFEEDFYRDAGIKANEIICRKFSGIPVQEKPPSQVTAPKLPASTANKRRTWFGSETPAQGAVKLETITGYKAKSCERKKSETLPARESVSLKKLGIGPRSKSFVLPSTLIYSEKASECQTTKLVFEKEKENKPEEGHGPRTEADANRFGFRAKTFGKVDSKERAMPRTKIPVLGNGSPAGSRSSSPGLGKSEPRLQANGTKKIPVVVSRKSMLIQSNAVRAEVKNNRRSLDPSKISLENMDRPKKPGGREKGGSNEEKAETESTCNGSLSKLPVRKSLQDSRDNSVSSNSTFRKPKPDK